MQEEQQNLEGIDYVNLNIEVAFTDKKGTLNMLFHSAIDQIAKTEEENNVSSSKEEHPGKLLIDNSDCRACHNEKVKTVGPSYFDIAEKYEDTEENHKELANKIKLGGKGNWGEAMMTAHPDLKAEDLAQMVAYIFSLSDSKSKDETQKAENLEHTLGLPNIAFEPVEKDQVEGNGFLLQTFEPYEDTYKFIGNYTAKNLHRYENLTLGERKKDFKMVVKTTLNIEKSGSYSFRLISDDGAYLFIDDKLVIDHGGYHGFTIKDGETNLNKGIHQLRIEYEQGGGGAGLSLQWFNKKKKVFTLVPTELLRYNETHFELSKPFEAPKSEEELALENRAPGDGKPLAGVHPSFDLFQARPNWFEPKVGGMDFLNEDTLILSTWDPDGSVYKISNYTAEDPDDIRVEKIAYGLAEPLGVRIVDGEIFVLQKQELTQLIDNDKDGLIDEYKTISNDWLVSDNFHEFAFGLDYMDGHFYATLATAILPGGASADPQIQDRGKAIKISQKNGKVTFIAHGLRTPNGIGFNQKDQLFVADNQGDWLPASKIVIS